MNPFRRRIQTAMQSGGGAAAFSPTDIAGLQLWLDASQIVGLNDGDPVATWSDLSGNANNATQATASNKPTYKTNQINSRPVVRFDGVDDFMTYANQLFTFTGDATVFAVLKVASAPALYFPAIISDYTGLTTTCSICPQTYPNGGVEFCTDVASPGGVRANSTDSTATAYLLTVAWQDWQNHKSNGQTTIRVNGVAKTVAAYGSNPASFTGGSRFIGTLANGAYGPADYLNGDIAALLVYNARLSAGDIALVETYLDGLYNP
jgi:hypothetical protein